MLNGTLGNSQNSVSLATEYPVLRETGLIATTRAVAKYRCSAVSIARPSCRMIINNPVVQYGLDQRKILIFEMKNFMK